MGSVDCLCDSASYPETVATAIYSVLLGEDGGRIIRDFNLKTEAVKEHSQLEET